MALRTWHKIHKWLWIFTGIFLLGWLVSGILMLLPTDALVGARPQVPPIPINYERIAIPPAQAIEISRRQIAREVPFKSIVLRSVHDRPLYAIKWQSAPEIVIDAVSGEPFRMSPPFARAIVRYNFPGVGSSLTVEKLDKHGLDYPWGPLPAYRVTSQDSPSTRYLVNPVDGKVFRSTPLSRARSAVIGMHEFSILKVIIPNDRIRKLLLLITAGIALVGALIGYYMALPHRRRDSVVMR